MEQVIKTALLWIEEDLSFRHGGSPVEINSQTLFADGYVQEKTGDAAFRKKYKQYMVPVEGVEGSIRWLLNLCGKIVSRRWGIVSLSAIYTMEISLRSSCGCCGEA